MGPDEVQAVTDLSSSFVEMLRMGPRGGLPDGINRRDVVARFAVKYTTEQLREFFTERRDQVCSQL